jgi:hypothetical protein
VIRGRPTVAAFAVSLSLVLAACGGDGSTDGGSSNPPTSTGIGSAVDHLRHPERVPDLIRERFGEAPSVRRIHLFRDSVLIELRDPAKPENLDDWTYRDGEWTSRPVSVSMSEIEALDDTTFQPSQVAWTAIPGLVQQALDGLDLEDEHVDAVSFDRLAGDPPRVYIGVTGLRGNGRLLANADGTDVEVARN